MGNTDTLHPNSCFCSFSIPTSEIFLNKILVTINNRITADLTKPIAKFSCTPCVQEVHTKAQVVHLTPGLLGLWVLFNIQPGKCIAKQMINPRISADWSMTKQIAKFSCTPFVQEVHTKAEDVHLTPCHLGLGVLFNIHA